MSDCPNLQTCPFFNDRMLNRPATAEVFKTRYCRDAWGECARYLVSEKLGIEAVPSDLFPNMQERALGLLDG